MYTLYASLLTSKILFEKGLKCNYKLSCTWIVCFGLMFVSLHAMLIILCTSWSIANRIWKCYSLTDTLAKEPVTSSLQSPALLVAIYWYGGQTQGNPMFCKLLLDFLTWFHHFFRICWSINAFASTEKLCWFSQVW